MRVVEIQTTAQQRRYVVIDDGGALVEPIVRYEIYAPIDEIEER